jgi:hydrogenase nickel incorporation protein HypA/HybF
VHELSLAGAVIDTVERHAAGRRVTVVYLRVGDLRQVVPTSLEFYFEHVARGTLCEGARLEQELVPARLRCRCGHGWELDGIAIFRCPVCGDADAAVVSGEEFLVESIDVTEQEHACTA